MNNFLPFIISCISGLSTVLGNLLLFINIKYKDKLLSFTMGLTFVVMFLISVLELIPEGIGMIYYRFNYIFIFCISLLFLMIGYILVNIIESRIECSSNLYKIGILSMLSVFIHNVPEGIICSPLSPEITGVSSLVAKAKLHPKIIKRDVNNKKFFIKFIKTSINLVNILCQ